MCNTPSSTHLVVEIAAHVGVDEVGLHDLLLVLLSYVLKCVCVVYVSTWVTFTLAPHINHEHKRV